MSRKYPKKWIQKCRFHYLCGLMLFNTTRKNITIKVGKVYVSQVNEAKLLGMTIDDRQSWKPHIIGTKGLKGP